MKNQKFAQLSSTELISTNGGYMVYEEKYGRGGYSNVGVDGGVIGEHGPFPWGKKRN